VPLSNFVPRGFGFVHHSAILYHEVPISRFATFSSLYESGARAHSSVQRDPRPRETDGN
jgi:hypothetical protein